MDNNYILLCNCCNINIYVNNNIKNNNMKEIENLITHEINCYIKNINMDLSCFLNDIYIEDIESKKVRETDDGNYFKSNKNIYVRYNDNLNLLTTIVHELSHVVFEVTNVDNKNIKEDNFIESRFLNEFLAYKSIENCFEFKYIKENLDIFLQSQNNNREEIYKVYNLSKQVFNNKKEKGINDEVTQLKNRLNIYNFYHRGFALGIVLSKYGYCEIFNILEANFLKKVNYYISKEDLENTSKLIESLELK
nr:MAG TPA: Protein of unknown function (DUF3920) [Caudoviricetes sp.]